MLKKRYFVLGLILGLLNIVLLYAQTQLVHLYDKEISTSGLYYDWLIFILVTGVLGSFLDMLAETWKKNNQKSNKKK